MPNATELRAEFLADIQESINDKESLLGSPEAHTKAMTDQVKTARQAGLIDAADEREYLEWIDSAYA